MSGKDNGGSAFPFEGGENNNLQPCYGMTLRDYFAANVMQGLAAHLSGPEKRSGEDNGQAHARVAYEWADAMLAERAK